MIIGDENISVKIIEKLRLSNIEIYSIFENKRGASDKEIIEFAQNPPKIIFQKTKTLAI